MLSSKISAIAILLTLLAGCDGCGSAIEAPAATAPTLDRSPAPLPEDASAVLRLGGGSSSLLELRRSVTNPLLRALVPPTPREALTRAYPELESFASHVPDGAPLVALILGNSDDAKRVIAARVTREANEALPLGVGVEVQEGGPRGGLWVVDAPGLDETAIALLDDVLVVGPDRQSVESAAPYLAFTALAEEVADGLSMSIPEGALAGSGRRAADRWLDETSRNGMRGVRAERARHDEAPTFGDPEAVVERLSSGAGTLAALLPDLGEAQLTLAVTPLGLELRGQASVTAGSPLARELSDITVGDGFGLAALPPGAALAWSTRSQSSAPGIETWLAIAGDRVDAPERAALTAAAEALAGSDRDTLMAFGANGSSPWFVHATVADGSFDEEPVAAAVSVPWLATMGATALSCEEPGRRSFAGEPGTRALPLCAGSGPLLHLIRRSNARVLAIADADSPEGTALADALASGRHSPGDPDTARALAALGDQTIAAGLLEPSRLLPALALFALPPIRAAARANERAGNAAPTVWAISRGEGVLELRVIVTPGGLDALVEALMPFMTPR